MSINNFISFPQTRDSLDCPDNVLDLVTAYPEQGRRTLAELKRNVFLFLVLGTASSFYVFVFLLAAFTLIWFLPALLIFPALLLFGANQSPSRLNNGFPSNLQCQPFAFFLAWKGKTQARSLPIYWDSIVAASIENCGNKEHFPYLYLDINLIDYKLADRLRLIYQTTALWTNWFPCRTRNECMDTLSITFPLHSLTLETDKLRLLSFVKSKVPESLMNDKLLTTTENKGTPTYTQLWLDDMQSFRRSRTGALPPGESLHEHKYVVTNLIATGGQARIYGARDEHLGMPVVLKEFVLPTNAGADVRNNSFASIKNEANFLSSLDHPGIVRLIDHFVEDHRAYLVLEFIEGTTLRNLVKDSGPLDENLAYQICRALCDLCNYLHTQEPPVVHRDLTPDNLILTNSGQLRLIDFSVAQHFEADRTKTVCGKHNYMAPEQFRGSPTTQSDLYALGGSLFFILTGADPVPLSCSTIPAESGISETFRTVVSKLTRMDASERYQSAVDVLAELPEVAEVAEVSELSEVSAIHQSIGEVRS